MTKEERKEFWIKTTQEAVQTLNQACIEKKLSSKEIREIFEPFETLQDFLVDDIFEIERVWETSTERCYSYE